MDEISLNGGSSELPSSDTSSYLLLGTFSLKRIPCGGSSEPLFWVTILEGVLVTSSEDLQRETSWRVHLGLAPRSLSLGTIQEYFPWKGPFEQGCVGIAWMAFRDTRSPSSRSVRLSFEARSWERIPPLDKGTGLKGRVDGILS
jgi:hypothetical protein